MRKADVPILDCSFSCSVDEECVNTDVQEGLVWNADVPRVDEEG